MTLHINKRKSSVASALVALPKDNLCGKRCNWRPLAMLYAVHTVREGCRW